MARKRTSAKQTTARRASALTGRPGRPSALLVTRIVYCGGCLDQLRKLPDGCVDLIYIDPPFNSNRNYEVFWGETKEKRALEGRHTSHYVKVMAGQHYPGCGSTRARDNLIDVGRDLLMSESSIREDAACA